MSIPVKVRTARKLHHCDAHDRFHIRPGDRYEIWTINADGEQGVLSLEVTGTGAGGGGDTSTGCSSIGGVTLWPLLGLLPWVLRRRRPS